MESTPRSRGTFLNSRVNESESSSNTSIFRANRLVSRGIVLSESKKNFFPLENTSIIRVKCGNTVLGIDAKGSYWLKQGHYRFVTYGSGKKKTIACFDPPSNKQRLLSVLLEQY